MRELLKDVGNLQQKWITGYNGQKGYFIDGKHIIYACDTTIKIANTTNKEIKSYEPFNISENINIKLLTANSFHNKIAFADCLVPPTVYVKNANDFSDVSRLIEGATLEYLAIEFSNGDVMLTLSGVPDLKITVWNWKSAEKLVEISLDQIEVPVHVSFAPGNWRNIIVAYKHRFDIWRLEQFENEFKSSKGLSFTLPPVPNVVQKSDNEEKINFNGNFQEPNIYPQSIIAGIDPKYEALLGSSNVQSQSYVCSCWANSDANGSGEYANMNTIYVGTNLNHIYSYSFVDAALVPGRDAPVSIQFVLATDEHEAKKLTLEEVNESEDAVIGSPYMIERMMLHRRGLIFSSSDGVIRMIDNDALKNSKNELKVLFKMQVESITYLHPNLDYTALAISTDKGIYSTSIQYDVLKQNQILVASEAVNQLKLVVDFGYGPTVGLKTIHPTNDLFLVLKKNGILQTWNVNQQSLLYSTYLNTDCTVLVTHPFMPLACVGTESGHLIFIDCSEYRKALRVLDKYKLHLKAVRKLKFNSSGTLLFSVGDDNKIYTIDTSLSDKVQNIIVKHEQRLVSPSLSAKAGDQGFYKTGFYVLGFSEFDGEIVAFDSIDMFNETTKTVSTRVGLAIYDATAAETIKKNEATSNSEVTILNADFNTKLLTSANEEDETNKKFGCKIVLFEINFDLFVDKSRLYANANKFDFKDDIINKLTVNSNYRLNDFSFISRTYIVAFVGRNLVKFQIPEVDLTKKVIKLPHLELSEVFGSHEIPYGCICRTINNQFLITAGYDGTLAVRSINDSKLISEMKGHHYDIGGYNLIAVNHDSSFIVSIGKDLNIAVIKWTCSIPEIEKYIRKTPFEGEFDASQLKRLSGISTSRTTQSDLTWLEQREVDCFKLEDEQFVPVKNDIIKGLDDLKVRLRDLMKVNNTREDIAKLEEHEFYLDLEELERLQKEADSKILSIRETKDFENTANLYLREIIKRECWDKMRVKGRGIEGFSGNLFVENYPLKDRSKVELKALEKIQTLRRIEIAEERSRREVLSDLMKKENSGTLIERDDDDLKDENTASNSNMSQNQGQGLTAVALKGSIGSMYDGESQYFYNQFEVYSCEQKWMQILLIQDAIYKIKENFNKEFEQVMQRKQQELAKVKEKNQRIKQIYVDLDENRTLKEAIMSEVENPEMLFEVKDEEIKVEKYLTPEQRRLLEEQLAEEARKRELERLDNWRDRGLMEMMGGVLQIRREDELKKDIPVPSFVKEKAQEDWSADEIKQYQIYEQKVKELNEEREKLRKQLNAEVGKLQEQIQECYSNFDNILFQLHYRKVKTQQAVYQEELKITRLLNSLVIHTELNRYETQINRKLDTLKDSKKELSQDIQRIKKTIEMFKDSLDTLIYEDKAQEKSFIREFSDVPSALREQLSRQFKRRIKTRFQINKTNMNPQSVVLAELGFDNPFSDRPSTAQQIVIQEEENEKAMSDLDNVSNAPIGLDQSVWERFVQFRNQKIEMENEIKNRTLILNEMNAYAAKRVEEDEQKRREIEENIKNLQEINDHKIKFDHNLQVQLIVKQGQVETDPGTNVHNFARCLLINRSVVDELNKVIQVHGKQKISVMVDCKNFKKNIRHLEWDHKKMAMQIEDYIQKQKDITYLKLTREVQEYLSSEDYDKKKQDEIAVLEKTLAFQGEQYTKKYGEQSNKLQVVKQYSIKTANNNNNLDDRLQETNVVFNEKKHINRDMFGNKAEKAREEKFKQIVQRRKFVDLAKAQAQEVAFLRSEVERLRMKTFPALVQIEF